jgi:hypothetical protein
MQQHTPTSLRQNTAATPPTPKPPYRPCCATLLPKLLL